MGVTDLLWLYSYCAASSATHSPAAFSNSPPLSVSPTSHPKLSPAVSSSPDIRVHRVAADEEFLPFASETFDLAVTSLRWQHVRMVDARTCIYITIILTCMLD